ncbi:MAG: hypothetical protein EXR67_05870 [Dehalococcoidia bacterium]|nr:hypothetical protein [Dehalococcoidia bacterium]
MSGTPKESVAREQRLPVVFILLALTGALAVSAGLIWVTLDYKQRRQAILSGVCIGVGAAVFTLGIILIGNLPAPPQSPDSLQVPIKALALPLDKVPLTGYHITQDEPISASQVRWEREFSNRSTIGGGYAWVDIRLYVVADPKVYGGGRELRLHAPARRQDATHQRGYYCHHCGSGNQGMQTHL